MNTFTSKQPLSFRDVALSCAREVVKKSAVGGLTLIAVVAVITALWCGVPIAFEYTFRFVTGGGVAPWRNVLLTLPLVALYAWCACVVAKLPDRDAIVNTMLGLYTTTIVLHVTCMIGFGITLPYAWALVERNNAMPTYEYVALVICAVVSVLAWIVAVTNGIFAMEALQERMQRAASDLTNLTFGPPEPPDTPAAP